MSQRIQQLQKLLAAEPNDAFCLYGLALEHAKLSDHVQALAYFDRTIAVDPDYCYAYFHKAKSQEELGEIDQARHTLRTGLDRAKAANDSKASSEMLSYLDEIT